MVWYWVTFLYTLQSPLQSRGGVWGACVGNVMSCCSSETWKKGRKAQLQRSAGANAPKSVIVLKHTYSDSTVNKFIYSYMKGGWELQCFQCASYIKGPLIFYYLKKQEWTGKIWLSTVKICTSFCSSHCYDIKCNTWTYIRTEESLPQLHCTLFIFHKAAFGSVPENWEEGREGNLHEERNISACILDKWSCTLSLE